MVQMQTWVAAKLQSAFQTYSTPCCSFASGTGKLFSFSLAGNQLAGGSEGKILFWDRRTGKQCGAFTDTHAEDVTQVIMSQRHPLPAGGGFKAACQCHALDIC